MNAISLYCVSLYSVTLNPKPKHETLTPKPVCVVVECERGVAILALAPTFDVIICVTRADAQEDVGR